MAMALERDHHAERLARIDLLVTQAKRTGAQRPSIERVMRENISKHLDELDKLRGPRTCRRGRI